MGDQNNNKRTFIAVLASHDDDLTNTKLAKLLDHLIAEQHDYVKRFRFVFTGGTFDRVILGSLPKDSKITPVSKKTRDFLCNECGIIRLPSRSEGGIIVLSYLIVQRKISIIWPFLTPVTSHWLNPENLALMRLCDQWHVKRLMNTGSVIEWIEKESISDVKRNRQPWPPYLKLGGSKIDIGFDLLMKESYQMKIPASVPFPVSFNAMTIALIAHDEMKSRMEEFATDYEHELAKFRRILSTGTTGRLVEEAAPLLKEQDLVYRYHSGPKGGDIEIATEVLFGGCHVVIFFLDPLHPHPHIEDIRVVFGACMIQDKVRMLSNEMQAREWIDRVVRGR